MKDEPMKDERISNRFFLIGLSFIVSSFIALSPVHATTREELEETKQAIDASRERKEKLTQEQEKIESELVELQKKLVDSAATAQDAETAMAAARENLRVIEKELAPIEAAVAEKNKKLTAMIQAATHLGTLPPGALIVMPGDESKMKAARAVKLLSDGIRKETGELRIQVEELARLRDKSASRSEELTKRQQALADQQKKLEKQMAERQALKEKLGKNQKEEEQKLADLVRKAQNLNTLISGAGRHTSTYYPGASSGNESQQRSFASAKGVLSPPIVGKLVQRFGATKREETVRGIVIAAGADHAQVVAPFDGQVVFTGPFLNYGKLVILKHSDDFHTLLAGLSSIDAGNGDFLLEGEPIGAMGSTDASKRLYVEIRKNNQPIDPAPWIKGLNKKR